MFIFITRKKNSIYKQTNMQKQNKNQQSQQQKARLDKHSSVSDLAYQWK